MSELKFLRTSEQEEAVRSLEFAARQAKEIANDLYSWKWVLISLHNAAQGFMVLALWNGNGLLSMRDDVAAKWLQAYREDKPLPQSRLDSFLNLYEKCRASKHFNYCGSQPFQSTESQNSSFIELNEFRNEFIHFTPKGWSLELSGLPSLVVDVLSLISFFGWESTSIHWYEQHHQTRAKWACRSLLRAMKSMEVANA